MKILAFAASNNTKSINRSLANFAANLISGAQVERLNIHDYEMPIFSDEREEALQQPKKAQDFFEKIGESDAIVVSYAEHNGSYTAAYKNLFDWASRINTKVFQDKPVLLLATSPGPSGAANVLAAAVESASYFGADLKASLSIPSFYDNFDIESNTFRNPDMESALKQAVRSLSNSLTDALPTAS